MEERKNGKGLVVLITILVLIILGLAGFIVYDKVLKKEKVEPNTIENSDNDNDIIELDLNDDVILNLVYPSQLLWFDENDKNWSYTNIKVDNMTRSDMMKIASFKVKCIDNDADVSEAECKGLTTYDKNSNSYLQISQCGADNPNTIKRYTKTYRAQQQEEFIYVYEYVQSVKVGLEEYSKTGGEEYEVAYLLDKNDNKIEQIDYNNYELIARKRINDGKADTYKWTFKKQSDGNYYFYSGNWE